MSPPANFGVPQRVAAANQGGKQQSADRVRQVRLRTSGATLERLPGGGFLVRPEEPLQSYPRVLTDRVAHWARVAPDRVCIAKRTPNSEWRRLTYAEVMLAVRSIGQALLDRGLNADRPVAILSENDVEHFLLMLAAQHVGVLSSSLSPQYSLVSSDFLQLRHALEVLNPGLVFVSDGARYGRAIESAIIRDTEVVCTRRLLSGRHCTPFWDS